MLESLNDARARAFAEYVGNDLNELFELRECRKAEGIEFVRFTVKPDVPSKPIYPGLLYEEPLVAVFFLGIGIMPEVWSERGDFPDVPHLNMVHRGFPKSLCLFGEDPNFVFMRWTASLLGERILWWFKENSRGRLHGPGQSLEPFLPAALKAIILPPQALSVPEGELFLDVYVANSGTRDEVFVADSADKLPRHLQGTKASLIQIELPGQIHGVIRTSPETLDQLQELCNNAGFDLLDSLKVQLRKRSGLGLENLRGTFLVLRVPMVRTEGGDVERIDYSVFRCVSNDGKELPPGELGVQLGFLAQMGGKYQALLSSDGAVQGASLNIRLEMLQPRLVLTPDEAAYASGSTESDRSKMVMFGLGALGSQTFAMLARQAFGRWTLVDEDVILPHNIVRHQVLGRRWGLYKAEEMAHGANTIFTEELASFVNADILFPMGQAEAILNASKDAQLIVDLTASTPVRRQLSLVEYGNARRFSGFFTPDGRDLVCMAEDGQREIPIDCIESQYIRAILNDPNLADHLPAFDEPFRFGGSCRDLSSRISPEPVSIHSAVVARTIRSIDSSTEAQLFVSRCNPESLEVVRHTIPLYPSHSSKVRNDSWTVKADAGLLQKLHEFRKAKLPSETCGVLLGDIDTQRKCLYLIDALPAPIDSEEDPSSCQRGIQGLADAIREAERKTWNQVSYVGEWHSHPDRAVCGPSDRDLIQMAWIADRMYPAGKPAFMLILCDQDLHCHLLCEPGDAI